MKLMDSDGQSAAAVEFFFPTVGLFKGVTTASVGVWWLAKL